MALSVAFAQKANIGNLDIYCKPNERDWISKSFSPHNPYCILWQYRTKVIVVGKKRGQKTCFSTEDTAFSVQAIEK